MLPQEGKPGGVLSRKNSLESSRGRPSTLGCSSATGHGQSCTPQTLPCTHPLPPRCPPAPTRLWVPHVSPAPSRSRSSSPPALCLQRGAAPPRPPPILQAASLDPPPQKFLPSEHLAPSFPPPQAGGGLAGAQRALGDPPGHKGPFVRSRSAGEGSCWLLTNTPGSFLRCGGAQDPQGHSHSFGAGSHGATPSPKHPPPGGGSQELPGLGEGEEMPANASLAGCLGVLVAASPLPRGPFPRGGQEPSRNPKGTRARRCRAG